MRIIVDYERRFIFKEKFLYMRLIEFKLRDNIYVLKIFRLEKIKDDR